MMRLASWSTLVLFWTFFGSAPSCAQQRRVQQEEMSVTDLLERYAKDLASPPMHSSNLQPGLMEILSDPVQRARGDSLMEGLVELAMTHPSDLVASAVIPVLVRGAVGSSQSERSVIGQLKRIYSSNRELSVRMAVLGSLPLVPVGDRVRALSWAEELVQEPSTSSMPPMESREAVAALAKLPGGIDRLRILLQEGKVVEPDARRFATIVTRTGGGGSL